MKKGDEQKIMKNEHNMEETLACNVYNKDTIGELVTMGREEVEEESEERKEEVENMRYDEKGRD